ARNSHSVIHSLDLQMVRWSLVFGSIVVQASEGLEVIISQAIHLRSSTLSSSPPCFRACVPEAEKVTESQALRTHHLNPHFSYAEFAI
uniref:Uncharacterized protein n=1 Tax=Peromyscus maniculatus bairdii TaxID=230844 RepID=A0A8C8UHT3_PERMB